MQKQKKNRPNSSSGKDQLRPGNHLVQEIKGKLAKLPMMTFNYRPNCYLFYALDQRNSGLIKYIPARGTPLSAYYFRLDIYRILYTRSNYSQSFPLLEVCHIKKKTQKPPLGDGNCIFFCAKLLFSRQKMLCRRHTPGSE